MKLKENKANLLLYGFAFVAIVLGLYGRFKGIGLWSLASDEYHTSKSIDYIMEKGLPEFDSGGYYTRGILYQYVQATILSIFDGAKEATLRATSVIFNLLALPALFILGRKLSGVMFGILLVCFFSLSIWEIEVARYVRMYAPFQALFLWYAVLLYFVCVEEKKQYYPWLIVLSVVGVFIYEASIFIVLLNFYPLLIKGKLPKLREFVIPTIVLGFTYLYLTTNFRATGVSSMPPDVVFDSLKQKAITIGPFERPMILLSYMLNHAIWFVSMVLLLFGIIYKQISYYKERIITGLELLIFITFFLLLMLNQLFLAGVFIILCGFLGWLTFSYPKYLLKTNALFAIFIILLFSVFYWFFLDKNLLFPGEIFDPLKKLLVVLLKYPDYFTKVFYQYFTVMPVEFVIVSGLMIIGLIQFFLRREKKESERLMYFVIFFCLTLMTMLAQPYYSTRYTFFLYPLFVLMAFNVVYTNVQTLRFRSHESLICVAILVLVSITFEDIKFGHLLNVDKPEYSFRQVYDKDVAEHLFTKFDYKTPANFVNKNLTGDDVVIATVLPVDYYLSQIDYFYMHYTGKEFRAISAAEGEKERWTNADLLYREEQFIDLLKRREKTFWLLLRSGEFPYQSAMEKKLAEKYGQRKVFSGIDGIIDVYKIVSK